MFCKKCGKEVEENWAKCPYCGNDIQAKYVNDLNIKEDNGKAPLSTARLVIGIISMVLCAFILLQSCAVGLANSLEDSGDVSGSIGFMVAICFLTAGIVGIVSRNSNKKTGAVFSCVFYGVAAFMTLGAGEIYGDLPIWGIVAAAFAVVFLISAVKYKGRR